MATVSPPIFLTLVFLLFFFVFSGGILRHAKGQEEGKDTWCIAKPSASEVELQNNIKYVCEELGLNCNMIQPGGACFEPQTRINHASVVMNVYYQVNKRNRWNCVFINSGIIAMQNPSYADCKYDYSN